MFNRYLRLLSVMTVLLIIVLFSLSTIVNAFSPNYNPSNLIDNGTFLNNSTMSATDIQSFLQNVGSGLANYSDVEACTTANAPYYTHCGQTISAAQIIYDSSQAYSINPRDIIATLEKEQSLITDPTPTSSQIDCAMGYNSCNGVVGFFNQVDGGAWQFRADMDLMQGISYWGYSPSSYPCASASSNYSNGLYPGNTVTFYDSGGTAETITLANAATATLYCYTPYVGPISVTGYSGSYNFVYYFQLWFGSTTSSSAYSWAYEGQSTYSDSGYTNLLTGTPTVLEGGDIYAQVVARNVGYENWQQAYMHLGTDDPQDSSSIFYDSSWLNPQRPAGMVQTSVTPGGDATFNFILHAPSTPGTFNQYFNLVDDGVTWLNDLGLYFKINVVAPSPSLSSNATILGSGQSISVNQYLLSPDGQSTLNLQEDGNLVLYSDYKPTWANYIFDSNVKYLVMQTDGNLVEYNSNNQPLWASNTYNNPGAYLALQIDGNLVIYSSSGTPLWSSGTVANPTYNNRLDYHIMSGNKLFRGQFLQTADRTYKLVLQNDGNLVLYHNGIPLWATMTVGSNAEYLAMQNDGNLVLYNNNSQPLWASWTNGQGPSNIYMQADGNLVIYNNNGQPTWDTGTYNGSNRL